MGKYMQICNLIKVNKIHYTQSTAQSWKSFYKTLSEAQLNHGKYLQNFNLIQVNEIPHIESHNLNHGKVSSKFNWNKVNKGSIMGNICKNVILIKVNKSSIMGNNLQKKNWSGRIKFIIFEVTY